MPDVEVICAACKGKRYNAETLEVSYEGKTIADILDMSIEEGVEFFAGVTTIGRKIAVLDDLGLGYITLGQSATTLSDGEAQRIKLATELSKLQRRNHVIDLGPGGGRHGGEVVAAGPPEAIAACRASHTGRFLVPLLGGSARRVCQAGVTVG